MEPNLENVSNEIVNASTSIPTPAPAPVKPAKSKGLVAATVIFAILAIAGIAGAVYFYMDANNKAAEKAELQAKLDLVEAETNATVDLTNSDEAEVKNLVKQVYASVSSSIDYGCFNTVFDEGSMIKIPDTDVYTLSNKSYGVASWGSCHDSSVEETIMTTAYTYAEAVLADNGFTEDKELMSSKLFYNPDNGIYCWVEENSRPFTMNCSKDTWISNEDKDLTLTLAGLVDGFYVSAKSSNIIDSPVSPYQNLKAYDLGAVLLFYRTSPDAEWQLFRASQDAIPCNEYTGDIAKAFAGDVCYDESTGQNSTVQP